MLCCHIWQYSTYVQCYLKLYFRNIMQWIYPKCFWNIFDYIVSSYIGLKIWLMHIDMTFNIFIYRLLLSIYLWVAALVISYVIKSSYTNFIPVLEFVHSNYFIYLQLYFNHFVLHSEVLMWFCFHFINHTLSDFHIFIFHFPFCDVSVTF